MKIKVFHEMEPNISIATEKYLKVLQILAMVRSVAKIIARVAFLFKKLLLLKFLRFRVQYLCHPAVFVIQQ